MRRLTVILVALVAHSLLPFAAAPSAIAGLPAPTGGFGNIYEAPADKKKPPPKTKVKVATKKGKARGVVIQSIGKTQSPNKQKQWNGSNTRKAEVKTSAQDRCWAATKELSCFGDGDQRGGTGADDLLLSGNIAAGLAVSLATQHDLPTPTPTFSPDPHNNEWKMLAVGFPIWLTAGDTRSVTTTRSVSGLTFTLTARWRSTTFDMGDGRSVTCTKMAVYSEAVKAGTPSPTCGHTYTTPSLPKGTYTVRTHSNWDVDWSVAGFSGTVPAYNTGDASIAIGELSALNR